MNKISKDKALEIISHSKGRFLSISGIKKDGSIRHYKSSKFNEDQNDEDGDKVERQIDQAF